MNVDIANLTGAFGAISLVGPLARQALAPLVEGVDLAAPAFPYLAVCMGIVGGISARFLRVGFVGEPGYEIHVPAIQGEALWDLLIEAGSALGIRPFGVEAQRLLRLEKGHVIIGQDTDGLTTPFEANMAWAVPKTKKQYRGKAAVEARRERGSDRLLVGFRLEQMGETPPENCLIVDGDTIIGRVTSAAMSEAADAGIGLAFLPPGRSTAGSAFEIRLPSGALIAAEVAATPFYDPGNQRQEL
jgi:sarcosine oxidase, subunit alpha